MIAVKMENSLRKKFPGVIITLGLNMQKNFFYLAKLEVPKDRRRKGLGTKVMWELVELSGKYGYPLELTPTSEWGTPIKVLKRFYKSFGFIEKPDGNMRYGK